MVRSPYLAQHIKVMIAMHTRLYVMDAGISLLRRGQVLMRRRRRKS